MTLEIARLERIAPAEQQAVLDEFYGLGLRRLRFVFDDLVKMEDRDIRLAYHDEDAATWTLALAGAARPVRDKVLGRSRLARPRTSAAPWPSWGPSGSTTPRPRRPTSPTASDASTTRDDSPSPTPTAGRRSSSDPAGERRAGEGWRGWSTSGMGGVA